MYHGFIAEGALVNNGKHISATTLVNPTSPLEHYFLISALVIIFCLYAQSVVACTVSFIFTQKIFLFEVNFNHVLYIYRNIFKKIRDNDLPTCHKQDECCQPFCLGGVEDILSSRQALKKYE